MHQILIPTTVFSIGYDILHGHFQQPRLPPPDAGGPLPLHLRLPRLLHSVRGGGGGGRQEEDQDRRDVAEVRTGEEARNWQSFSVKLGEFELEHCRVSKC